jgi:hypothetical protein
MVSDVIALGSACRLLLLIDITLFGSLDSGLASPVWVLADVPHPLAELPWKQKEGHE